MKLTKFGVKLFLLFLLVTIVPLGIAGTIVYKYVHDRTREEVQRHLRSTAHSLNEQLKLLLSKRRIRVVDFSSDGFISDCVEQMNRKTPDYSEISERLNTYLIKKQKRLDPDLIEVSILNKGGEVIASSSRHQIGKDKSSEVYFRDPFLSLESKGPYFSDALERSEKGEELQLVFSAILADKDLHRPMGVLVTKVKGNILEGILKEPMYRSDKESFVDPSGEIYIVNSNKLMLLNSRFLEGSGFNQIVDTKAVKEVLTSKRELSGIYENYKGIRVLGTALFVPEANWVILAEKYVKDAFLPLLRIKYVFLLSGGGVLFLVFIFAFVISGKTNAIIQKLIEGTKRMADGDLEHPITIGKRSDEIKDLVESFNLMMNKLRESIREKDMLSREIYHRVKNNMQVISSLLRLQSSHIKDEKYVEIFKESQNRIKAMALIHEKLYRSKDLANIDFNDYIKNLVNDLFLSYKVSDGKVALKMNIETVPFGIDTAIPCGLIVNELVTNSLKYAFPGKKDGEIKISLRQIPIDTSQPGNQRLPNADSESEMFELIVSDNGIGIPEELDYRNTQSLGLRLITNLSENQLQGKLGLKRNGGTEFRLNFQEVKYKERI
ncbi:MAG: HAMP domain-containing protein [Candidatus Scalindua sp.]|nr:HAMP domain-containing protein [Candidatus Scalindua sp.]